VFPKHEYEATTMDWKSLKYIFEDIFGVGIYSTKKKKMKGFI
jgi:hypothetical protein